MGNDWMVENQESDQMSLLFEAPTDFHPDYFCG